MLELLALVLAGIHFGFPLSYYWYAKTRWLPRPWNIKVDEGYKPKITVILPTYNEAEIIRKRLDNLYYQAYPKDLTEVIVIDSASEDGTAEAVRKWAREKNVDLKLLEERERKGKLNALKTALKEISRESEIVVFTDADAFWEPDALEKVAKYFADPKVGCVTASMGYTEASLEENYRNFYNKIRIAESKLHSTPVHNGPFLAIRAKVLRENGLPDFPASDDSAFGSFTAFQGYRAIQVDDLLVKEPLRGNVLRRKLRRAQHLILSFLKTKRYAKNMGVCVGSPFDHIWRMEWWLHVANPWLLAGSFMSLLAGIFYGSIVAWVLIGIGLVLLASMKSFRMWVLQQVYLLVAMVRNLWTKEIMWKR